MDEKRQRILKRVIIIAMFTALCFAATYINVPMPTGDMVHLGNFVMIMAALLLGGIEGGVVGSLGMGIYDIIMFSNRPSTIIRTFILKFLIGFIVGFMFRLVLKKKLNTTKLLVGALGFFLVLFGVSLGFFISGNFSEFSFGNGLNVIVNNFFGSGKSVKISLYIPIFSLVFVIGMIFAIIFQRKLSLRSKAALFAITIAILANILGEFILRWVLEGIFNTYVSNIEAGFTVSLATATSKIPGSLITGFLSIALATLIYEPVYRGVKNLDVFKDNTENLIEEEKEEIKSDDVSDLHFEK